MFIVKRTILRFSGKTVRRQSGMWYQLEFGVCGNILARYSGENNQTIWDFLHVHLILCAGHRVCVVLRSGNEKQKLGRNTIGLGV